MYAPARSLKPSKPVPERNRRRWRWLIVLLFLLLGYGSYRLARADPDLREYRDLRKELFSAEAKNLSPEERTAKFQALRELGKNLSPAAKQELAEEGRKRFEAELDHYRALSPDDKVRYLDERIDRMQPGRPNGPRNAAAPAVKSGGPPRGQRQNLSAEDREKRRKQHLDQTTPEFRAKMDQFFRDMQTRRQQRGLPTMGR